jgi:trans-2,3-dihydro-3-hydroxyanthranilate isomerase
MLQVRYVRCDVFSNRPFGGNPLAVFTDARALTSDTMQRIAAEMNLSETVFLLPAEQGHTAKLRIFTPKLELPFAGHPTLGAALVLSRPLQTDRLTLETRIGPIAIRIEREGAVPKGAYMTLPPPTVEPVEDPQLVLDALGLESTVSPLRRYSYGISHIVVEVDDPTLVSGLVPNFAELTYLGPVGVVVCAVTGRGATSSQHGAPLAVRARVFVPGAGVPEDPATGSAVGPIALHLQRHFQEGHPQEVVITQGVELGRSSELRALVHSTEGQIRQIEVGGDGVILGRGEWQLPGQVSGS